MTTAITTMTTTMASAAARDTMAIKFQYMSLKCERVAHFKSLLTDYWELKPDNSQRFTHSHTSTAMGQVFNVQLFAQIIARILLNCKFHALRAYIFDSITPWVYVSPSLKFVVVFFRWTKHQLDCFVSTDKFNPMSWRIEITAHFRLINVHLICTNKSALSKSLWISTFQPVIFQCLFSIRMNHIAMIATHKFPPIHIELIVYYINIYVVQVDNIKFGIFGMQLIYVDGFWCITIDRKFNTMRWPSVSYVSFNVWHESRLVKMASRFDRYQWLSKW